MKKTLKISILVSVLVISAGFFILFFPNVKTSNTDGYLYIPSGADENTINQILEEQKIIRFQPSFRLMAWALNYGKNIHPGRYKLSNGMGNLAFIRQLRSGKQVPVKVTYNNIRTKEELAGRLSHQLEMDSTALISLFYNKEFLANYGFTPNTVPALFIPNTFEMYWNISPEKFFTKIHKEYQRFWNNERLKKADQAGLTAIQASTLASIIQAEQTTKTEEWPMIAGLYINRLNREMLLMSDPTVIFANKNFGVKRVAGQMLEINSPYNTYKFQGLPPGPINLPDKRAIDAVLNYKKHNYIYMCAKDDFSGNHVFTTNYEEHQIYARKFRRALDKRNIK